MTACNGTQQSTVDTPASGLQYLKGDHLLPYPLQFITH